MFRPPQVLSGVCAAVIQEQDIQAVRKSLGKGIDEELEHVGIQVRQFQKEALAGRGLYGAIDVEPFEDVLDHADRLHPTSGEAPPADGQQTAAAFVLAEHAHRTGIVRRNDALQPLLTGRLKFLDGA